MGSSKETRYSVLKAFFIRRPTTSGSLLKSHLDGNEWHNNDLDSSYKH